MDLVVAVVAIVVFLGSWCTWTAGRLDRLRARVESAWAALDAQLVRRAAVAAELAAHIRRHHLIDEMLARAMERAALVASREHGPSREVTENDLSRAIRAVLADPRVRRASGKTADLVDALERAATRVGFARQFYNDAVRDNIRLRRRWLPRLLTIRYRHEPQSTYFEIDDTSLPEGQLAAPR